MSCDIVRRLAVLVVSLGVASAALAQNSFTINDQTVALGATNVQVPLLVTSSEMRHGLSFSIKYDQTKLSLTSFNFAGTATASADWDGGLIHQANGEAVWGIVMGFNPDVDPATFDENKVLPAGNNITAAFLVFDVIAAAAGTATVQYMNDLASFAPTLTKNSMTTAGSSVAPTLDTATITITGGGGGKRFLRGDCNGDGATGGVTDAVTMLTANFIGGVAIKCVAACDANGDGGTGGVTDAVTILTNNFIGGVQIKPPFPACGPQPDGEALSCDDVSACP